MIPDLVFPLAGGLVLLLLFYDILVTVFHPHGGGGPINRVQSHGVWMLFRAFGTGPDGRPRRKLLAFCGPVLAVLTISIWILILIVGFALVFYPFIAAFPVDPGTAEPRWVKALYFSGYVASTLGIGDVVPPSPVFRLLTVLEAMAGFVLFAISVSYVLAVYREIGVASALSLDLSGYFRRGVRDVIEAAHRVGYDPIDSWLDETTRVLLRITQAHAQYPIIHYFHSPDPRQALPVQLGHLVEYLKQTGGEEAGPYETARASPSRDALRATLETHLREINRHVVPDRFEPLEAGGEGASLERQYGRILRYLLYRPADAHPESH